MESLNIICEKTLYNVIDTITITLAFQNESDFWKHFSHDEHGKIIKNTHTIRYQNT